jgi:hypothetical protein
VIELEALDSEGELGEGVLAEGSVVHFEDLDLGRVRERGERRRGEGERRRDKEGGGEG